LIFHTVSLTQLAELATKLADCTSPPLTICLWGDLGAGKTTFARFFIQSLLRISEDIPSPTFTLIQTYDSTKGEVWHCDLYRLKTPEEVEELGLIEAFSHTICLIEWPERIMAYLPQNRLDVKLSINLNQTRTVEYITHGSTSLPNF
jgi:tRNA threonylcarbamoyladenosine biosynthesis protein TsaE